MLDEKRPDVDTVTIYTVDFHHPAQMIPNYISMRQYPAPKGMIVPEFREYTTRTTLRFDVKAGTQIRYCVYNAALLGETEKPKAKDTMGHIVLSRSVDEK